MTKKKVKPMPVIPPEDGEIERHDANYRLNPMGHRELVINKKGAEEQTLSELTDDINGLVESMEIDYSNSISSEQPTFDRAQNRRKIKSAQFVGASGDSIRSAGESVNNMTGTTPRMADGPDESRAKSNLSANVKTGIIPNKYIAGSRPSEIAQNLVQQESITGTAGIAITPMPHNVAARKKKKKSVKSENAMSKSLNELLNEWEPEFKAGDYKPGDHKMDNLGGSGVVSKSTKRDRVGKRDTETKKVGEAWPRKHNETVAMCDVDEDGVENKPQGSHVSKHGDPSDGHTSELGHNWPNQPKHTGGGVAEPVDGNRYSDGGVLKGSTSEPMEWSPLKIGQLMNEQDVSLQPLFDNYTRANEQVSLEGFQELCDAHALGVVLDESTMLSLMSSNREFMFHEHADSDGVYWLAEPVTSELALNEMQIRSPEEEAGLYKDYFPEGDPHYAPGHGDDAVEDDIDLMDYNESMDEVEELDHTHGGGRFGGEDVEGVCVGCEYRGCEETCPQCGHMMMQGEGDIEDRPDHDLGDLPRDRYDITHFESVKKFMASAKSILENAQGSTRNQITKALNESWRTHARNCDLRKVPGNAYETITQIAVKFPGFNPLAESKAMLPAKGKSVATKSTKSSDLPSQPNPDEMKTHGDKNLLGKSQKNTYTKTPVMPGTGKGMTESRKDR